MTPDQEAATRQCPFCKEDVRADAIRCKHCQASIPPTQPGHGGVCPLCKEDINPDAIRCKHCKADLVARARCSCPDCGPATAREVGRSLSRPTKRVLRRRGQSQARDPRLSALFEASAPCDGCNHYEVDDVGVWCFLDCGEIYCFYELCNPPPPIDEHPF